MVSQSEMISTGFHSLVPGLISIFLATVWVTLNCKLIIVSLRRLTCEHGHIGLVFYLPVLVYLERALNCLGLINFSVLFEQTFRKVSAMTIIWTHFQFSKVHEKHFYFLVLYLLGFVFL